MQKTFDGEGPVLEPGLQRDKAIPSTELQKVTLREDPVQHVVGNQIRKASQQGRRRSLQRRMVKAIFFP